MGAPWSPDEVAYLCNNYPGQLWPDVRRGLPKRTPSAIRAQAQLYRLKRKFRSPVLPRRQSTDPIIKVLIEERMAQRLSQRELAKRVGVREDVLSNWERGSRQPLYLNMVAWVETLRFELDLKRRTEP